MRNEKHALRYQRFTHKCTIHIDDSLILSSFRREAFAFIPKYCYFSTFQEISNQFRNQGIFLKFWRTGPSGLPQFEKVSESVSWSNVEIFIFVMIRKL